jgi:hypothetical protein
MQRDLEAVHVPTCSVFLKLQFATWWGLANIVVCTGFGSKWMNHSQLCQSTSNSKLLSSFSCPRMKLPTKLLDSYGKDIVDVNTVVLLGEKIKG